ncbi:MAG: TlyA family RNA methyltransferase [Deltaproteobacteria bacterium]|jgi:23S rRNA (cytidine1920-2'-O)/16S rRNA (cytidine1409-2'-O)-methyltransferase|nr:TlyA family RNA methyltransferase [Deltaproteobacteria bacterium]
MPPKIRADELVMRLGLAPTRSQAQALIMAGRVLKGPDSPVGKAGELLGADLALTLSPGRVFVSRGGEKLSGALDDLGVDPRGLVCLDLGASTGGFTDCLLKRGAERVTALDVGKGLLHPSLRDDPRVTVIEEVNARHLDRLDPKRDLKGPFGLAVLDLSFISLELVLPLAAPLMKEGSLIIPMVKPQFEVGRRDVGKGGVVRDPALVEKAVEKIKALAPGLSPPFRALKSAPSRLKGPKGNREVFVLFEKA